MSTEGAKSHQSKSSKQSKEELIQTIRKKLECKAKAKIVIESFLQPLVVSEEFVKMVKIQHINQSHYEDVVEERFILKICGYPLCANLLVNIPTKKYQISTTTNKVYDITYRKMFCSTKCFKASEYIKSQMLTSPLWLRDQEDIPEFKILEESK